MRALAILLPLFLLLTFAGLTPPAQGQVSVDMRALDPGGTARPAPPPRRAAPERHSGTETPGSGQGNASTAPVERRAARPAPAPPEATRERRTAPATAAGGKSAGVKPPPAPLPTEPPPAPPSSTMIPAPMIPAPVAAVPLPSVRLTFADGASGLTPGDEEAIRDLARSLPAAPAGNSINVVAYAAGKPNDPSTARRLSLSRGMAVRTVLIDSGVPSSQIYVRALGAAAPDAPADRVELTVARIGTVAP